MRRNKSFTGLKEEGKKSSDYWGVFSIVGYLLILAFTYFGITIWTCNIFIGIGAAILAVVSLFFITYFMENAKVNGNSSMLLLLWILFILTSLAASVFSYHYLHSFYNQKYSVIKVKRENIENIQALYVRYEAEINACQNTFASQCNFQAIAADLATLQQQVMPVINSLPYISNPIYPDNLTDLCGEVVGPDYAYYEKYISKSIDNFNSMPQKDCKIKNFDYSKKYPVNNVVTVSNNPFTSLLNSNILWLLGFFVVTSLLILVPYFIADEAKTILRRRN